MYKVRPPFAVRRLNSAAIVNKTNKIKRTRKSKTVRQKSKSNAEVNERMNRIETRVDALENAVTSIIDLTVNDEISKYGTDGTDGTDSKIITPRFSDSDNYANGDTNGDTGISQYFRTDVEPPNPDFLLIDAVKNGDYNSTRTLIDVKGANPNIRDSNEQSLPSIAYLNTIANKEPQEYNKIIRYLLGLRQLDQEIKKEYTEFIKLYNKKHRKLGGKSKSRSRKSKSRSHKSK